MPNLSFVYRDDEIPARRRVFQGERPEFLLSGSVKIEDGFVIDANGRLTTYAVTRPFAFFDPALPYRSSLINPGDRNLVPLQFLRGRVTVQPPQRKMVLLTSSPTHQFLNGRLRMLGVSAGGLLTDFAVWGSAQSDPTDFYVESATDLTSGGVTQPWTRNNAIFVPHRKARYIAVGSRLYGLPNTGAFRTHYVNKWMLEKASVGQNAPTSKYGMAREVVVKVRPDRINLYPNPSFDIDTSSVNVHSGATTSLVADPPAGNYLRVTRGTDGSAILATLYPIKARPNSSMSFSLRARLDPSHSQATQDFTLSVLGFTSGGAFVGTATNGVITVRLTKSWRTFTLNNAVTSNDSTLGLVGIRFTPVASMLAADSINLDDVIVEAAKTVGTFFSGSTSADTIWEQGGVVGKSRSYLYKNRTERYAAIQRVLEDNVPLGIGTAEPVFGTLPSDW